MKYTAAFLVCIGAVQWVHGLSAPKKLTFPINPKYSAEEWWKIVGAQVSKPDNNAKHAQETVSQEGSAGAASGSAGAASRIVNGAQASPGQFPWQAQLVIDQSTFCGGSLISASWVLTAAHCSYEGSVFVITLGATYLNSQEAGSVTTYAAAKAVHAQFDLETLTNDITLLQLPQPVTLSSLINTVALPSQYQASSLDGQTVFISGWGKTSDEASSISQVLNYVEQTVISNSQCASLYGSMINSGKLCVTGSNLQSACHGDSGGPLVLARGAGGYVQVGIVSSGPPTGCDSGYPTLYTRVSSHLQWISTYTGLALAH